MLLVKDMIAHYLESLRRDGREIPEPDAKEVVIKRINVTLAR
jgi:predicted RNase H-like HicB family nuclease